MAAEAAFIAAMRALATHPAARGLLDDAAVLAVGGEKLVVTHDMIVEGIHFLGSDPPADVAWKLVAVNLSDLAAKGAEPLGVLLGYSLSTDAWDAAFAEGLGTALRAFELPLFGGDTVAGAAGAPRSFGLTAIGRGGAAVPSRAGAASGDILWVSGTIGDAGAGLRIARGEKGPDALLGRYRNPRPRLEAGQRLAPLVSAMMDVSDGLLIDAEQLAEASGAAIEIDLALVPLSPSFIAWLRDGREARLFAACAGDDYELLFAAPEVRTQDILRLADELSLPLSRIGGVAAGSGLRISEAGAAVALPDRLGWQHRGN